MADQPLGHLAANGQEGIEGGHGLLKNHPHLASPKGVPLPIQKQVLVLLNKLKKDVSTGVLFITHDLGVVAEIADRVIALMYTPRRTGKYFFSLRSSKSFFLSSLLSEVPGPAKEG